MNAYRKYPLLLLMAACLWAMQACSTEDDLDAIKVAGISADKSDAAKKKPVPFRAYYEFTIQRLSDPPILQLRLTGGGNATHLGKTTFVTYNTADFTQGPPYPISGSTVITAANGDELHSTYTGTSEPLEGGTRYLNTLYQTVTGGTGRFSDASGTYTIISYNTTGVPEATASIEGEIAY